MYIDSLSDAVLINIQIQTEKMEYELLRSLFYSLRCKALDSQTTSEIQFNGYYDMDIDMAVNDAERI
jgi:hypothetical protein